MSITDTDATVELDTFEPDQPEDQPDRAASLLGRIKARRDEQTANETLTLPVPTWDGELLARYRVLERKVLEKLNAAAKRKQGAAVNGDADFLIRACVGLFVVDDDGEQVALEDESGPIRFDSRLAAKLDVPAETARDVVMYAFKGNDLAVGSHAAKVAQWMTDTSQEVDGEVLGESSASPRST